jgi:hypothetical protein
VVWEFQQCEHCLAQIADSLTPLCREEALYFWSIA